MARTKWQKPLINPMAIYDPETAITATTTITAIIMGFPLVFRELAIPIGVRSG